jgi:hypothetical protein
MYAKLDQAHVGTEPFRQASISPITAPNSLVCFEHRVQAEAERHGNYGGKPLVTPTNMR